MSVSKSLLGILISLFLGAVFLFAGSTNSILIDGVNVTVDEIPAIVLSISDQQDALCNSTNSGMAVIGVNQGSAPFTFSWDNSSSVDSIAQDLGAGIHTVTVTDLNGCSDQISVTIGEPDPLSINDLTINGNQPLVDQKNEVYLILFK